MLATTLRTIVTGNLPSRIPEFLLKDVDVLHLLSLTPCYLGLRALKVQLVPVGIKRSLFLTLDEPAWMERSGPGNNLVPFLLSELLMSTTLEIIFI